MTASVPGRPGILLVLDGWGHAPADPANALTSAHTPVLDRLVTGPGCALVDASGEAVGLLAGTVGNSEIGHLVIGAGRPVPYDSLLVQRQIDSGELRTHQALKSLCAGLADTGRSLHLVGLCSDGQIHANLEHLREFLASAATHHVAEVFVHVITDGRDVADGTAPHCLDRVGEIIAEAGVGRIATVIGRGHALDKAGNLDLTEGAARAIADGAGRPFERAEDTLREHDGSDEWVPCCVITDSDGAPVGPVADGDAVLFFNFRSDRIAQLADFLVEHTAATERAVAFVSLTRYDTRAAIPALVERADASGGLAEELDRLGLTSVRVAEAEKFDHVTYYLNGRDGTPRQVEEHVRIHTPGTPDYRARPQMRLAEVTDAVITAATRTDVALVVANLANIDVVGHTGDFAATVAAAEHTDAAVADILTTASDTGRWVLLVGDHGNAELMIKNGKPYGGHTTNPVPLVVIAPEGPLPVRDDGGSLADVAPTVLALLGHHPAPAMTGRSLLMTTTVYTEPTALQQALRVAACGLDAPWIDGPLSNAETATADAFSAEASVEPVDIGSGLWAAVRTSVDKTSTVLCVHNISDRPCSFDPTPFLPSPLGVGSALRFVHGHVRTEETGDGSLTCHLDARSFVWLSRVTTPADR